MMGERVRLCVACEEPSPGPTKRLYYQHRDYGPFFPILEEQRRKSNGYLFSGARVAVCTLCASHLLRQWAYYEKNWTPLEKRTYTLFSEERLARKALKESLISKVSMGTNEDPVELDEHENHLSKTTKISPRDKGYETMSDKTLEKSERWSGEEGMDSRKSRSQALWSLPSEDIRSQVREELQENIDVMIRKVAEIQYYENLRKYEKELKDAAERMCRVQDSKGDIDRMCHHLKSQLHEELLFRDTLKVLNEEKKENNVDEKALLSIEPPPTELPKSHSRKQSSKPRMTGITHAKKAGKEWQGKTVRKKLRERAAASQPTENSLALVPVPTEEEPEASKASSRNDGERAASASRKLDVVVRELEKEREWRKRTEGIIAQQREMIEDLRNGIQGEVQRLIEKQNKRYDEIKANAGKSPRRQQTPGPRAGPNGVSRPNHHKTPYISFDRASSADQDAADDDEKRTRSREPRRQRRDRSRDQWEYKRDVPSPPRNKKYDDGKKNEIPDDDDDNDDDDDVTADSDDEESSPATPEFYIQ